jgi:nucleoside-diphosphate-sugar epimerase
LADIVLNAYRESSSKIVYSGERDPEENRERKICIEKAKRELGFCPQYDLRAGLKKIADAGDEINFFEEEN